MTDDWQKGVMADCSAQIGWPTSMAVIEPSNPAEPAPPWVVFPDLKVWDSRNQGSVEAYIYLNWIPFWDSLNPTEKEQYLDRWQVSEEWRHDIAECYGPEPDNLAEEALEDEADWVTRERLTRLSLKDRLFRLLGL